MEKIPTITIDTDKKCPKCGEKGTTGNGLCMSCNAKRMIAKIGPNVTGKMLAMIADLFTVYETEMDKAYRQCGEEPFKISIGLKLDPGDRGIDIETSISFVTGRIKDKTIGTGSETQQNLFKEE